MRWGPRVAVLLLVACTQTALPAPTSAETFLERYLDALCRANVGCCPAPTQRFESVEACVTARRGDLIDMQLAAYEDPRISFDADAAASVVATLDEMSRTCVAPATGLDFFDVFVGTLAIGGDCGGSVEAVLYACAPGTLCASSSATAAACVAPQAIGDPCTTRVCESREGLFCASDHTCAVLPRAGDPCLVLVDGSSMCAFGTSCDGAHTCVAGLPDGASCAGGMPCAGTCLDGTCVASWIAEACALGP